MFFSPDVVCLELPGTSKYLNILTACISEMLQRVEGLVEPEKTIYNIQLAVHEGCTNIVDHAYEHSNGRIVVTLTLNHDPYQLVVELFDTGQPFTPPEQHLMPGKAQIRGYGLFLMEQIMDEIRYDPMPGHNCWRLTKNLLTMPISAAQ